MASTDPIAQLRGVSYSDNMSQSLFPTTENDQRRVISVSDLNSQIRDCLQNTFPSVWVSGEISDLARPQSGHIYLTLKDDVGQLRAVLWRSTASRLDFDLEDGMQVFCEGEVDVYPPRGTYQLIVRKVEPQGLGGLQLALKQLRERLAREGLFDPSHKKPLPRFPKHIAVVTSPTGAAVRDFMEVVKRRWSGSRVTVIPTRVQGAEAVPEIVQAIRISHQLQPRPDVLVVTRGGGSLEDLWCFNDEHVVREMFAAEIPVISAIGHEIDVTLADLVADLRALTPTEAGERVVPSRDDILSELQGWLDRMNANLNLRLKTLRAQLDGFASRPVLTRPEQRLVDLTQQVDDLSERILRAINLQIGQGKEQLTHYASQLEALSPLAVLGRGYSLTQLAEDDTLVRSSSQLRDGDKIRSRLSQGTVISQVLEIEEDEV